MHMPSHRRVRKTMDRTLESYDRKVKRQKRAPAAPAPAPVKKMTWDEALRLL